MTQINLQDKYDYTHDISLGVVLTACLTKPTSADVGIEYLGVDELTKARHSEVKWFRFRFKFQGEGWAAYTCHRGDSIEVSISEPHSLNG